MTLRIFTEPQQGASYDQLLAVAQTAEECGFGAFFRSDHVLRMGDRTGTPTVTDAWITLAGLARDTTSIRLGTLVTPATFRAAGSMAVTIAQVDHMSGGRIEIGLGTGWYAEEHRAFGIEFPELRTRMARLDDQLAILSGLWAAPAGGTFELRGATTAVAIDADSVRPLQRPHPPIIMGGAAKARSAQLAVAHADEYNAAFDSVAESQAVHDRIRRACEQAGRDPGSVVYSVAQVVCCGKTEGEVERRAVAIGRDPAELRENGLAGSPQEVLAKLEQFDAAGVERYYLQLLDLSDHDHLRLIADSVLPHAPGR